MIELNEEYNDATSLHDYYPIIRENLQKLLAGILFESIKEMPTSGEMKTTDEGYDLYKYTAEGGEEEGVYFFPGFASSDRLPIHALYLGRPDGEHFGGVIDLDREDVALVRLTREAGAEVLFTAQAPGYLAKGAVITEHLADKAVTTAKIADKAVNGDKIANNTIKTANMANNAIRAQNIEQNAVTTVKIIDGAVTPAKLDRSYLEVGDTWASSPEDTTEGAPHTIYLE